MRIGLAVGLLVFGSSCGDTGPLQHAAAGTTAGLLAMAQPALQMESDYELASRALPGALKTIEGFYVADASPVLRGILTEGYCQYATAFVEDEWEVAKFAKKLDEVDYDNQRASKMFARCMNYAFMDLPAGTEKDLFGAPEGVAKRIKSIGLADRTPFMWSIVGMGGMINHNLTRVEMLSLLPTVKAGLERVVAIDTAQRGEIDGTKKVPCDAACTVRLALPHIALGLVYSAASPQFGGDPKRASNEFNIALRITSDKDHPDGKMLLARTLWAYRVGLQSNDRKLFHDQLVKVLETDPAIWPEQRLANEVAQRRARRYLSHEKELFQ
ncbi:MAG TPA: TRAP transporter TatT component family protein [Kofleriaceae bacterium]